MVSIRVIQLRITASNMWVGSSDTRRHNSRCASSRLCGLSLETCGKITPGNWGYYSYVIYILLYYPRTHAGSPRGRVHWTTQAEHEWCMLANHVCAYSPRAVLVGIRGICTVHVEACLVGDSHIVLHTCVGTSISGSLEAVASMKSGKTWILLKRGLTYSIERSCGP